MWALLALTAGAAPERPFDLSGALSLVDWLAWAGTDREVDRYVAAAHEPGSIYAQSLREADRAGAAEAEMPALYAVEAQVGGVQHDGRERMLLQIREAIVYRNPAPVPLMGLALRAIYLPWLNDTAIALQGLATSIDFTKRPPPPEEAAILFVDGLRMDLAQRLHALLAGDGAKATIGWQWSGFPTVTATCKPFASPVARDFSGTDPSAGFMAQSADGKPGPFTMRRFHSQNSIHALNS